MNKLVAFTALSGALLFSGVSLATPTLGDLTGNSAFDGVYASGAESVRLSDTTGVVDDTTAFLFLEDAGFAASNTFGIYEFSVDSFGVVTVLDTLEIFSGADSSTSGGAFGGGPATGTVAFDLTQPEATVAGVDGIFGTQDDVSAMIDDTFGFYLGSGNGDIYYTHASLNAGGADMALIYDVNAYSGSFSGSNIIIAWEDVVGGDYDYNDMVVGVSDVVIPEPSIIALFGLGLIGMGFIGRRKKS